MENPLADREKKNRVTSGSRSTTDVYTACRKPQLLIGPFVSLLWFRCFGTISRWTFVSKPGAWTYAGACLMCPSAGSVRGPSSAALAEEVRHCVQRARGARRRCNFRQVHMRWYSKFVCPIPIQGHSPGLAGPAVFLALAPRGVFSAGNRRGGRLECCNR